MGIRNAIVFGNETFGWNVGGKRANARAGPLIGALDGALDGALAGALDGALAGALARPALASSNTPWLNTIVFSPRLAG